MQKLCSTTFSTFGKHHFRKHVFKFVPKLFCSRFVGENVCSQTKTNRQQMLLPTLFRSSVPPLLASRPRSLAWLWPLFPFFHHYTWWSPHIRVHTLLESMLWTLVVWTCVWIFVVDSCFGFACYCLCILFNRNQRICNHGSSWRIFKKECLMHFLTQLFKQFCFRNIISKTISKTCFRTHFAKHVCKDMLQEKEEKCCFQLLSK